MSSVETTWDVMFVNPRGRTLDEREWMTRLPDEEIALERLLQCRAENPDWHVWAKRVETTREAVIEAW